MPISSDWFPSLNPTRLGCLAWRLGYLAFFLFFTSTLFSLLLSKSPGWPILPYYSLLICHAHFSALIRLGSHPHYVPSFFFLSVRNIIWAASRLEYGGRRARQMLSVWLLSSFLQSHAIPSITCAFWYHIFASLLFDRFFYLTLAHCSFALLRSHG